MGIKNALLLNVLSRSTSASFYAYSMNTTMFMPMVHQKEEDDDDDGKTHLSDWAYAIDVMDHDALDDSKILQAMKTLLVNRTTIAPRCCIADCDNTFVYCMTLSCDCGCAREDLSYFCGKHSMLALRASTTLHPYPSMVSPGDTQAIADIASPALTITDAASSSYVSSSLSSSPPPCVYTNSGHLCVISITPGGGDTHDW